MHLLATISHAFPLANCLLHFPLPIHLQPAIAASNIHNHLSHLIINVSLYPKMKNNILNETKSSLHSDRCPKESSNIIIKLGYWISPNDCRRIMQPYCSSDTAESKHENQTRESVKIYHGCTWKARDVMHFRDRISSRRKCLTDISGPYRETLYGGKKHFTVCSLFCMLSSNGEELLEKQFLGESHSANLCTDGYRSCHC